MDRRTMVWIGIGLLVALGALLLFSSWVGLSLESFQLAGTCGKGTACYKCAELTTCSDCLAQKENLCGWCADAGRCVQKMAGKPALPITPSGGAEKPDYFIPKEDGKTVDAMCKLTTFVARAEDCSDFDCTTIKDCQDCYRTKKCVFCTDTKKCYNKKEDGTPDTGDDTTACGSKKIVTAPEQCPKIKCEELTDCDFCVSRSDCGFCGSTNKCVTLDSFGQGVELDENGAPKKDEKGEVIVKCEQADVKKAAYQCPGAKGSGQKAADFGESEGGVLSDEEIAARLLKRQKVAGLLPGTDEDTSFLLPESEGPVSEGKTYSTVTAPGVSRSAGSSGARSTYPEAGSLPGRGPFEDYIQMLVRSELSAQGVPVVETFQVQDVLLNAGQYASEVLKGIFKPVINLRFLEPRS